MTLLKVLLTSFMTLLVIGLQAQANDFQTFKNNVKNIVNNDDAKEVKKEKVIDALWNYTAKYRQDETKKGEDVISRQELDEILVVLKEAGPIFDDDNKKNKPKSRGAVSLEDCLNCYAYGYGNGIIPVFEGCRECRQCLDPIPWHGMPGVVLIMSYSCGAIVECVPVFEFMAEYCSKISQ